MHVFMSSKNKLDISIPGNYNLCHMTSSISPLNAILAPRRRRGRPSLGPAERMVLTLRPEDRAELMALANGRQIAAFILDAVRYAAAHRPVSRVEQPVSTRYGFQRLESGALMQGVVIIYKDGRTSTRFTGIEYTDEAQAQRDCDQLNRQT